MKTNKIQLIIEIVFFIILMIYGTVTIFIPNYKKAFGSSDKFINTSKYKSMVEFKIDQTNFALILDKNYNVYQILYFDETSYCLYNQNIENNKIDIAINQIIRRLIKNNCLKSDSNIILTTYENNYSKKVIKTFKKYLNKYSINTDFTINNNSLIKKAKSLSEEDIDSDSYALFVLDLYSKDLIEIVKTTSKEIDNITEKQARIYANNVYKKIELFMDTNNIKNLEKNNKKLIISEIAADQDELYFPTNNSYFYIKNSKVYAYIEINDLSNTYSYCYNGSIDNYQKGECK